ncbi:MAG: YlbF family regulator [Eubacteriales bacterium]
MNSDLYLKSSDLAKAIYDSEEAQELRESEKKIREDKVANNLTERWQKVHQKITAIQESGEKLSEQDEKSIEFIEAKVENHPLLLNYMDAHNNFTKMLEEINSILSGALTLETNEDEVDASCITCPARGGCQATPDSCDSNK